MSAGKRLLIAAAAGLAVAIVFWANTSREGSSTDQPAVSVSAPAARTATPPRPGASPAKEPVSPLVVDEIVREDIEKAVVMYSPEALPTFERFLASNEPDVREAARDGLTRLGEKGGAAILRHATVRMTDPEEIKRMQETADWLELPPATDGPMKK